MRGFFSVVYPEDSGYPPSKAQHGLRSTNLANSAQFAELVSKMSKAKEYGQALLLGNVFNVDRRLGNKSLDDLSPEALSSLACFNGRSGASGGRNLEEYLLLIANMSKPATETQVRYYSARIREIQLSKSLDSLAEIELFDFKAGESSHIRLWRSITNSSRDFDPETSRAVILFLIEHIGDFSLLAAADLGLGLRDDLPYYLVRLLDGCGWSDEEDKHAFNTDKNIAEIAEWVFGENRHHDHGIIDKLAEEKRGVLGWNDVLHFRNSCSVNRGGDVYNVQRALSLHHNPNAAPEGNVNLLATEELREVSQTIFAMFNRQYIERNVNVFKEIDSLTLSDITGKSYDYVKSQVEQGKLPEIESSILNVKSNLTVFIVYQLAGKEREHGVGCGYYDVIGIADSGEIHKVMNDYFFDTCFALHLDPNNARHFVDYLMMSFSFVSSRTGAAKHVPHLAQVLRVLDGERLKAYWLAGRDLIVTCCLENVGREVVTPNYSASYRESFVEIVGVLDAFVEGE